MKKILLISFLFFIVVLTPGFAQKVKQKNGFTILELLTPPNGVHLYDNVFIDETEIANIHYLEYLHYLATDSTEDLYNSQTPDPDAWEIKLQRDDSTSHYLYHYFRYPGYRYFPVIGVTYEQALKYCEWRGKAVTLIFQDLKKHPELKEFDIVIEYRLPTKAEWEYAAGLRHASEFKYGTKRPTSKTYQVRTDQCGCEDCLKENGISDKTQILQRVEFNVVDDYYKPGYLETIICEDKEFPAPEYIYDGPSNNNRLYQMIGNVSEMVMEKGIAKGGSFRNKLSEFDLSTDFHYEGATEWVGFRCIAIVHMRKK